MELHKRVVEMEKLEAEREQKKMELKAIEKKIHSLFDKEKDGIGIIQNGLIKYSNPDGASLLGYLPEELIDKPFAFCLHHEEITKVAKLYLKRLSGEDTPITYETKVYHKNGDVISIEVRASKIKYHGKPADFVLIKKIEKNR